MKLIYMERTIKLLGSLDGVKTQEIIKSGESIFREKNEAYLKIIL